MKSKKYDGLGLFSGGLDGLLAIKLLEEQGLKIKPLHFFSPFFGFPAKRGHWKKVYGLDVSMIDVGQDFVDMLAKGPAYGVGKVINPCVDCKILLLTKARTLLAKYDAKFIATGEVVGQRPMSQRRDTLNVISRDAQVRDVLLRPLCAKSLPPTPAEESGLVDRSRLGDFFGRGRKAQFELAARYGITDLPTPAGGCLLTEKENARRYWPLFYFLNQPKASYFYLANVGRQYWFKNVWFSLGRNRQDNENLLSFFQEGDICLSLKDFAGPLGLLRIIAPEAPLQNLFATVAEEEPAVEPLVAVAPEDSVLLGEVLQQAGALLASFAPQASKTDAAVVVQAKKIGPVQRQTGQETEFEDCVRERLDFVVLPRRDSFFKELSWPEVSPCIKARYKVP